MVETESARIKGEYFTVFVEQAKDCNVNLTFQLLKLENPDADIPKVFEEMRKELYEIEDRVKSIVDVNYF